MVTKKASKQKYITSRLRWFSAFHGFVAVYAEKYAKATSALMSYMETIRKLGQLAGEEAGLHYDIS